MVQTAAGSALVSGLNGVWRSPLTKTPERVIVTAAPNIAAFDAKTGAKLWSELSGQGAGQVVSGEYVYYYGENGLFARSVMNGHLLWSWITRIGFSRPAVLGNSVYVTAGSNQIYALDARTGQVLWQVENPYQNPGNPVAYEYEGQTLVIFEVGRYFIEDSFLVGLDGATGALLWKSDTPVAGAMQACTDPISIFSGGVQVGTPDGRLVTLNGLSGELWWQLQLSDIGFSSSPTWAPY
ncbi:outer membrane protein assembly factor BamB [Paraburkholderia sp. Clong3]|uniref:outer membrane protein assembly factor BamB family protein n=1 Tax=Paraburkholderia sp. Clong3 TaxID=2991061 RepID=UPI003D1C04DA